MNVDPARWFRQQGTCRVDQVWSCPNQRPSGRKCLGGASLNEKGGNKKDIAPGTLLMSTYF